MEPWAHDIIDGTNNNQLILLEASTKVNLLKSDEHGEHTHKHEEENAFAWSGVFELNEGKYKWSFAKVNGEYSDPTMKIVILKSENIESAKSKAEILMESEIIIQKKDNEVLIPVEAPYLLIFDDTKDRTVFTINLEEEGKYVFFTEHMNMYLKKTFSKTLMEKILSQ